MDWTTAAPAGMAKFSSPCLLESGHTSLISMHTGVTMQYDSWGALKSPTTLELMQVSKGSQISKVTQVSMQGHPINFRMQGRLQRHYRNQRQYGKVVGSCLPSSTASRLIISVFWHLYSVLSIKLQLLNICIWNPWSTRLARAGAKLLDVLLVSDLQDICMGRSVSESTNNITGFKDPKKSETPRIAVRQRNRGTRTPWWT